MHVDLSRLHTKINFAPALQADLRTTVVFRSRRVSLFVRRTRPPKPARPKLPIHPQSVWFDRSSTRGRQTEHCSDWTDRVGKKSWSCPSKELRLVILIFSRVDFLSVFNRSGT